MKDSSNAFKLTREKKIDIEIYKHNGEDIETKQIVNEVITIIL